MKPVYCLFGVFFLVIHRKLMYRGKRFERVLERDFRGYPRTIKAIVLHLGWLWQPYTVFVVAFLAYLAWVSYRFHALYQEYGFLDPARFKRPNITNNSHEYTIPSWLSWMAVVTPFCLLGIATITVFHLGKHVRRRKIGQRQNTAEAILTTNTESILSSGFSHEAGSAPQACDSFVSVDTNDDDMSYDSNILRWYPTYSHDLAMQIVALPLVYGVFALDNVCQLLSLITGDYYVEWYPWEAANPDTDIQYRAWNRTEYLAMQTYLTNFELADLWEAWSLRCFGLICFALVGRQLELEAPTVDGIIQYFERHFEGVRSADKHFKNLLMLKSARKLLFEPLQITSYFGVKVFVWVYAIQSLYLLSIQVVAMPPFNLKICGTGSFLEGALCSLTPYLTGAAFLASCLAIYNLVIFERSMEQILELHEFRPVQKFLSVKLLVSIVFLLEYSLDLCLGKLFDNLPDVQIKLVYSCVICYVLVPISYIVYVAWKPTRLKVDWYEACTPEDYTVMLANTGHDEAWMKAAKHDGKQAWKEIYSLVFRSKRSTDADYIFELKGNVKGAVQEQDCEVLKQLIETLGRRKITFTIVQATHNFENGNMGITCDDDGFVISADGAARTKGIKTGDQIVKVGSEPYSQAALVRAEQSGVDYEVTVSTQSRITANYRLPAPLPRQLSALDISDRNRDD